MAVPTGIAKEVISVANHSRELLRKFLLYQLFTYRKLTYLSTPSTGVPFPPKPQ